MKVHFNILLLAIGILIQSKKEEIGKYSFSIRIMTNLFYTLWLNGLPKKVESFLLIASAIHVKHVRRYAR